jgi:hypothetical protein
VFQKVPKMKVLLFTFVFFINGILQVFSQNCAEAPTPALKIVCEQIHRWDKNARSAPPVTTKIALPPAIPGGFGPMIAAELAPIASSPSQCMDLGNPTFPHFL